MVVPLEQTWLISNATILQELSLVSFPAPQSRLRIPTLSLDYETMLSYGCPAAEHVKVCTCFLMTVMTCSSGNGLCPTPSHEPSLQAVSSPSPPPPVACQNFNYPCTTFYCLEGARQSSNVCVQSPSPSCKKHIIALR